MASEAQKFGRDTKGGFKSFLNLTIFCLCLINGHAAQACTFEDSSAPPEAFFRKAETVFWAHVTQTEEKTADSLKFMNQAESFSLGPSRTKTGEKNGPHIVEATFDVVEIFKGNPPDDHVVRDLVISPGNCATPLVVGFDYMFFISKKDDGFHYVGLPTGTRVLEYPENKKVKDFIEQIRQLKLEK